MLHMRRHASNDDSDIFWEGQFLQGDHIDSHWTSLMREAGDCVGRGTGGRRMGMRERAVRGIARGRDEGRRVVYVINSGHHWRVVFTDSALGAVYMFDPMG